jgi:hypothetical protein
VTCSALAERLQETQALELGLVAPQSGFGYAATLLPIPAWLHPE